MIHARDIRLVRRIAAYMAVLAGYLFYCYNFVLLDYVRPYLIRDVGFSIKQTAVFTVGQNIGITLGAIACADLIARFGRRNAAVGIAAAIGIVAMAQALAHAFLPFLGLRGLMSAALAGYYVVATSIVVALFPPSVRGKLIALNSTMFPCSNILIGLAGGALGDARWHLLMWLGAVPILVAPMLLLLLPGDRGYEAYDDHRGTSHAGGWREMLSPRYRGVTIGCIALSGLDFDAYGLFVGFLTVYLKRTHGLDAAQMGDTVALISTGSLIGGFCWAALTDRFGRKSALAGYLIAAVAILLFLYGGLGLLELRIVGMVYGFGLSCTYAWGAWFAELFPPHLRPHGAALFHAGNLFALGAPIVGAYLTQRIGLVASMSIAAIVYCAGALLWSWMPETVGRRARDRTREAVT